MELLNHKTLNKIPFFLLLVFGQIVFGQHTLEDIPTRQLEKQAKKSTKIYLDSKAQVLDLNRKDRRIKRFELLYCEKKLNDTISGTTWTPTGDFLLLMTVRGFILTAIAEIQTIADTKLGSSTTGKVKL